MRLVGQGQVLANMFPNRDKCIARVAAIIAAANHQHNDKQPTPPTNTTQATCCKPEHAATHDLLLLVLLLHLASLAPCTENTPPLPTHTDTRHYPAAFQTPNRE